MSTHWGYGIDLPLKAGIALDIDALIARIDVAFYDSAPMDMDPILGPGIDYEGRSFIGIDGISSADGRLRIGGWGSNLDRTLSAEESYVRSRIDGITVMGRRRVDVMLLVLSELSDAAPGDVVGSISIESDWADHAHPIVACEDGILRVARTRLSEERATDRIVVGDRLPLEAIRVSGDIASIDENCLVEMLTAASANGPART